MGQYRLSPEIAFVLRSEALQRGTQWTVGTRFLIEDQELKINYTAGSGGDEWLVQLITRW